MRIQLEHYQPDTDSPFKEEWLDKDKQWYPDNNHNPTGYNGIRPKKKATKR